MRQDKTRQYGDIANNKNALYIGCTTPNLFS